MNDLQAAILAVVVITPFACARDERPPETPQRDAPPAGAPETGPAPATTNEPSNGETPKLNDSPRQTDPSGTSPISDSRTRTMPFKVAQVMGGSAGWGGFGGMPAGAGGTIVTQR